MHSLIQDLRYAFRQIARSPGFSSAAIITLAVGLGANTALFTLANSVLLRTLPGVHDDGRLVWITPTSLDAGRALQMPYPDFVDYRAASDVFEQAAAFANAEFSLSGGDLPVRVHGQIVSGSFFSVLGASMERGRGFSAAEDDHPGSPAVVVISDRLWRERFAANPDILGYRIVLDGIPFTIVGVAQPRFAGAELADREQDVWVPLAMQPRVMPGLALDSRDAWWLSAFARLRPGVSLERARSVTATIAARIASSDAGHAHVTANLLSMRGGIQPKDAAQIAPIGLLAALATGLVLFLCCANVSNMLLGRAMRRRHEIAVRLSMGATRRRLVRQLITESLVLALGATMAGLVLALWATDAITAAILPTADVSLNWPVLAFAAVASIVTSLLFGLVPAVHATRGDLANALKSALGSLDRRRSRLQGALVVAQIAMSVVLLATCGMFLGGLYRATHAELAFDASSHVLAASFDLGMQGYTREGAAAFVDQLEQQTAALPGVTAVSTTNVVPLGNRRTGADVALDPRESGGTVNLNGHGGGVYDNIVRPGFFHAVGIDLVAGRDFNSDDVATSPGVVIVSEDFARRAWPGSDPLGKHVRVGGDTAPMLTVISVARTALTFGVGERLRPIVYRSRLQVSRDRDVTLLVRSAGDATLLSPAIRSILRSLNPDLPVYEMQSLGAYRRSRLSDMAIGSTLLGLIGGLALLLATLGIYAVIAFCVGQRTREIGLRIALGAAAGDVSLMFLRQGVRLTAVGLILGLVLAGALARAVATQFSAVAVVNPAVFTAVSTLLGGVALLATWLPARKAASVDPMIALRAD